MRVCRPEVELPSSSPVPALLLRMAMGKSDFYQTMLGNEALACQRLNNVLRWARFIFATGRGRARTRMNMREDFRLSASSQYALSLCLA